MTNGINVNDIKVSALCYADDTALFIDTKRGLQNMVNRIY